MDFSNSEDRQMLADTVNRFLRDRYNFDTRQRIAASPAGLSVDVWKKLADLGMVGALFEEAAGGLGGSGFDIMVLFEALGRALVVEPFLGTLMAGRLISDRPELVQNVIAGEAIVLLAHEEVDSRYDGSVVSVRAERRADGWLLSGRKTVVPQLEAADFLCVSARTSGVSGDEAGISLFLVPVSAQGVVVQGYSLVDGGRGGELLLNDVNLDGGALIGDEGRAFGAIAAALAAGVVGLAAEALGIMDVLKNAAIDYLRTRSQFNMPIGKFQALQHRMATVLLEIEQARSALINAAAGLSSDQRTRERAASAAKYTIGRVGTLVAEEAIQMHGGIGMTWELPLSHYAKRLIMIGHQLGDEDHHLERYIKLSQVA
jgi:alkylation response protein AidB-like acyl-CoA dehydrogenase